MKYPKHNFSAQTLKKIIFMHNEHRKTLKYASKSNKQVVDGLRSSS